MNMKSTSKTGFTLVELIVVITILAILWTIAFLSFQWYSKDSRDSVRVTDISNIQKTLALYISKTGSYPTPSNEISIEYLWATIWSQWTFWKDVVDKMWMLNKWPVDPLTTNEYTYSVNKIWNEYQVWALLEQSLEAFLPINKTNAISKKIARAFVKWEFNWTISLISTWWIDYILATPSLIVNDLSTTNILNLTNNFVYHNQYNLPASYSVSNFDVNWWFNFTPINIVVFSWSVLSDLESWSKIFDLATNLQTSYSWSVVNQYSQGNSSTNKANLMKTTWDTLSKILPLSKLEEVISCEEIFNKWKSSWDGVYNIFTKDLNEIYQVYCDMTNEWWTFLFSVDPAWITWRYSSTQWTNPILDEWIKDVNIFQNEFTSTAYSKYIWNKVKLCRWNLNQCYIITHNWNRTLQSFYNTWDKYTDFSRCLPWSHCDSWQLPDDIWIDNKINFYQDLWFGTTSWQQKYWVWINLSIKNKLWMQIDDNNTWPDFDNNWLWIWVFRSHNCWRKDIAFTDTNRARSIWLSSSCAYETPDNQIWFVFSK